MIAAPVAAPWRSTSRRETPALPLVKETDEGAWYLAEDFAFSERARQAGTYVHADTRIRLRHIGRYAYQWRWEDAGAEPKRDSSYRISLK